MEQKRIVVIATLDTKGEEAAYMKSLITERGHIPLLIDAGVFSGQYSSVADVRNDKVANSVGLTIEKIRNSKDEGEAISLMIEGVSSVVEQLLIEDKIDGLVSIGGSMGTSLGLKVMQNISFNIPKLMVSTIAFTPIVPPGSASIDQIMMQTIADLRGLNTITKMVLKRAVGAICGAVEEQSREASKEKPAVGISGLGGHKIVEYCRSLLKEKGYEPINFPSTGTNALEKLIMDGFFDGVLDISIFELVNLVCGGHIKGGEQKLVAACEKGTPQVIAPGALDFFAWMGGSDTLPCKYKDRYIHPHNPLVDLIATSEEEKIAVLEQIIERVNRARGPTVLLIPLKGFSRLDEEGMPFHNPGMGKKVFDILKQGITNNRVEVIEIDAHINDPIFAETAVNLICRGMYLNDVGSQNRIRY